MFIPASALTSRAQTAHTEDISKEFEYVESVIQKGVSDGDMQKLAQAHVTMSNLELAVSSLDKPEDKALFSLAAAYDYVELCPTAIVLSLSSASNPTGFSFDCQERAEYYFNRSLSYAQNAKTLSKGEMADISFLVGIGYDRLKSNLASLNVDTKKFYDLALSYVKKSDELGAGFDGVRVVLNRLAGDGEYKTKQVIDDDQYNDLHRMLYYSRSLPQPAVEAGESAAASATSTIAASGAPMKIRILIINGGSP